jgi:hypothetical protein
VSLLIAERDRIGGDSKVKRRTGSSMLPAMKKLIVLVIVVVVAVLAVKKLQDSTV